MEPLWSRYGAVIYCTVQAVMKRGMKLKERCTSRDVANVRWTFTLHNAKIVVGT